MNRLVDVKDETGSIVQRNIYNFKGQLIKVIDAAGYQSAATDDNRYGIEYTYDIGNRLKTITTPESKQRGKSSQSYTYDAMSNVISMTDGEGNTTDYQRDLWGKVTKITDAKGIDTKYSYDYAGNLISMTDGNGHITRYEYNSMNLIAKIIDAKGQEIVYKYDMEGRLRQELDRNGQTIKYEYNADHNLTKRSIDGIIEESYLYNKDGSLLAAINSNGVDTYQYTPNGYLSQKHRNKKLELQYQYYKNGNIKNVTDGLGNTTAYTYDIIGRLKNVLNGTNQVAEYVYNVDSTISRINYSTGININYTYDKDKNITSLVNKNPEGAVIGSYSYNYDNNGNMLSKVENGETTGYTYDQLNRLALVEYPQNILEEYTYDNAGNRLTKTKGDTATTYAYDELNRLLESVQNGISTTYSYDNNGNQLSRNENGNITNYEYDGFNRLIETKNSDGTWQRNVYNSTGLRIAAFENGQRYDFTFDRGSIITEQDASGQLISRNIRGYKLIEQQDIKNNISYYLHNAHGDVTNIIDGQGNILNSYTYDAFGNLETYVEKVTNRFMYAGEQFDKITGEYYLRARYYNPTIGRFTQEDTYRGSIMQPHSLNLYAYVANNPIKYVDPSGHELDVAEGTGNPNGKKKTGNNTTTSTSTSSSTSSNSGSKCDGGSSGDSNYSNPNELITKDGITLTAEEWYLMDNLGGFETGFWDGFSSAPNRSEDYNFPFEEYYDYYEEGYAWGEAGSAYLSVFAGAAEYNGEAKTTSDTSLPPKPEVSYRDVWAQSAGSGNGKSVVNETSPTNNGVSRPPNTSTPNSIYEQLNPDGTVKSRAFYDSNGNQFSRQDFDHKHFDKSTQQYYQPHEHNYYYNNDGLPIGNSDGPLPDGYKNIPTN